MSGKVKTKSFVPAVIIAVLTVIFSRDHVEAANLSINIGLHYLIPSFTQVTSRRMIADEINQRGIQLRADIEQRYAELSAEQQLKPMGGNDISDIVLKYIPVGTSFDDAEKLLWLAGFNVDPRPSAHPLGNRPDKYDVVASIDPFIGHLFYKTSVYVHLSPKIPGDYNEVSKVYAGIAVSFT
jgi:hypothetical protein